MKWRTRQYTLTGWLIATLVAACWADVGPSEDVEPPAGKSKAGKTERKVVEVSQKPQTSPAQAEQSQPARLRWGGDIRIREERFNNIPIKADPPGVTRGGLNDFFRFRTRIWGEADLQPNVTFRVRAVNEFRLWNEPDPAPVLQRSNYDPPEEVVFDNLYIQFRNLAKDRLDLTIGRQELIYGTGFLVLEGTPKDGSRTIYFNAVRGVWRHDKDTTLDLFGIWNRSEDPLAINSSDRDLTGLTSANDDITEKGVGVYLQERGSKNLPYDLYVIYKRETEWTQPAKTNAQGSYIPPKLAWQKLDASRGLYENPDTDVVALGLRLLPKFNDALKANIEMAYQFGERGDERISAFGTDAFLLYGPSALHSVTGELRAGLYYLSGDDPKTAKDEGWNPLWARYPQYSELYVYAWDAEGAGRWSNIMMPNLGISLKPTSWLALSAMGGYLWAPEADGPQGGHERGWLGVAKAEFTVRKGLLTKKDSLSGHLWFEVLEPGDYYKVDETAYFVRWQLLYTF